MLKQPNLFHSQPSTLPKKALAKFYLSTIFGLSFMISSVPGDLNRCAQRRMGRCYFQQSKQLRNGTCYGLLPKGHEDSN